MSTTSTTAPGRETAARSPRSSRRLANLSPMDQLRAGRLGRRVPQLFVGLTLFGVAMGLFVQAQVGLDPWDVFHQGVAKHTALSIGAVTIVTSVFVLLLWIPLKQWPGLGTLANAFWLGLCLNWTVALVDTPGSLAARVAMFVFALVINGLGGALYIGSQLGPGPRDGLMTGLNRRTGVSVRLARTGVEVAALAVGWVLGGQVGVGTVAFALLIGPLTQFFLPHCIVPLDEPVTTPGQN